jgi:glycosyltransferase involved in cell wall biosynthesis
MIVKSQSGSGKLEKILIDLTPLLPGGENGGAKFLAIELVRQLSRQVAPQCQYYLLTSSDTHAELADLDANNVHRLCVNQRHIQPDQPDSKSSGKSVKQRIIHQIGLTLEYLLPKNYYRQVYAFYQKRFKYPAAQNSIQSIEADLLFCPFTAALYYSPKTPTIIVVHDLQFQNYPQFFSNDDNAHTDYYFRQACQVADGLICVSNFTRQAVLKCGLIPEDRVLTIHSTLINPLNRVDRVIEAQVLEQYHLRQDHYLLYPANFWQHKNHEMLLTAMGIFFQAYPASDLKLVLTGSPSERSEFLQLAIQKMGLQDKLLFTGFVDTPTFSALLQACLAVIFPSLYEGFGFPVLEAMHFGKPVLCSNTTSLPEIAEKAAHYFDPRKPEDICSAIETIETDSSYRKELIEQGSLRMKDFSNVAEWAQAYYDVFLKTTQRKRILPSAIQGVYTDHWVGKALEMTIAPGNNSRSLVLDLDIPPWLPKEHLAISIQINEEKTRKIILEKGKRDSIHLDLPEKSADILLSFSPTIQPVSLGFNADDRQLSCRVIDCKLISASQVEYLYRSNI